MIILNTTLPRSQATYLWIIEGYSQQSWQPAKGPRLLPFRSPVEITIEKARENAYLHAGKTQGRKQEVGGKDRQPGQEDTNKPAATFVDFIDMFRWQGSFRLHFLFSVFCCCWQSNFLHRMSFLFLPNGTALASFFLARAWP